MAQVDSATAANPPVVRTFESHAQAREAILALGAAGVERESVSIVTRSPAEAETLEEDTGVSEDVEDATQSHHAWSDFVDWLGRVESVAVPGFGAVLGSGDLWQDISIAGSGHGSITGALVGVGVPVDRAARLEEAVLEGKILVIVHGEFDAEAVQAVLGG